MKNHKRSRNFLLAAGFLMLFAALGPWNNRDIVGRVIFTPDYSTNQLIS